MMLRRGFLGLLALTSLGFARRYDAASVVAGWAIDGYQAVLSPLQGRQVCNFNPSCSQFSEQAVDRYGLSLGLLMTADRLERCNPLAQGYYGSLYHGVAEGRMNDPLTDHAPDQGERGQGSGYVIADSREQIAESRDQKADNGYLIPDSREQIAESRNQESESEYLTGANLPDQLAFADYLFRKGDFGRAIGEYRRFEFTDSSPRLRIYARTMIAESYLRNGEFAESERAFRDATTYENYNVCYLGLARALFQEQRCDAARHYAALVRDSSLFRPARVLQAWCMFRRFRFRRGAGILADFAQDSVLGPVARMDGSGLARRSRAVSSMLSAVIPGLGQAYSGRTGDGAFSFLVTGTAALASYYYWNHPEQDKSRVKFGLCAGVGTLFYLGNVYGANIAARDYNRRSRSDYLARIEAVLSGINLQPDYHSLLER